jgi:ATP-dependent DNA helicase RecQ
MRMLPHASKGGANDNLGDGALASDANPTAKRGQTDGMVGSAKEPAMKQQKIQEHGVESSGTTGVTEESVLEFVASHDGVSGHPIIPSEAWLETHVVPVVLC